ncbi:threonine synthase [Rhodohalobacter sp.]|uniref:threonine synthase n=1 Tax=Rhodohalobacter sp. TaxID=1974210 RepID=UPI002ACECBAB|nr:threonine synthase [Rhodohalobacter sp.]MDZ7756561.1 threonine synthase [Rhodohalobacter sp.]
MKFISTRDNSPAVSFFEAMRRGLAPDGGLYMPEQIPKISEDFWSSIPGKSFPEIAFEMAKPYLEEELTENTLRTVVEEAFDFPVRMKSLGNRQHVLELFHGPTLAFKDFGARFMARLFSENAQKESEEVTILVATSGDTGGAVAHGFYKVPGVKVCLLYPKGKVSPLQEKQMTTLGENITALEVDGVFDDCQRLVKKAFLDKELNEKLQLSSANSINIARLLPQSFYYAYAAGKLMEQGVSDPPVFSVPSGNFGNLTGGMLAGQMGLPIKHFLAATNVNDVVPEYLRSGDFKPKDSVQTISNAMDVGNPSNFSRMKFLFKSSGSKMKDQISGYSYSDEETRQTILDVYKEEEGYLLCPHTAIGYRAAIEYQSETNTGNHLITLATAHPVKFRDVIEPEIDKKIELPARLNRTLKNKKKALSIDKNYGSFKEQLMQLHSR